MRKALIYTSLIVFSAMLATAITAAAQDTPAQDTSATQPSSEEEQQKEKEAKQKRALVLLDQIVDEVQFLKLPENRVKVQIGTADLFWEYNEGRARSLFSLAADTLAEMMRSSNVRRTNNRRQDFDQGARMQLRQELVLTVARHDVPLAYQLLANTRPPVAASDAQSSRNADLDLEQRLLTQIAAADPKLALRNAEQLLEKGEFPRCLPELLGQLWMKDNDAAAKLEDKMLRQLRSANMLTTPDAGMLAISLLQPGPRMDSPAPSATGTSTNQLLPPAAFQELLGGVVDAALKATAQSSTNRSGPNSFRGRANSAVAAGGGQGNSSNAATDEQMEQANARRLLTGLLTLLPQIDQNLPLRAAAVRQKMMELGLTGGTGASFEQVAIAMQQGTVDSLLAAAPAAPPQLQSRLYHQAALKALDEGNPDRARQIANDHLEAPARDAFLQTLELRQAAAKTDASNLEGLRQTLSRLASDDERINLLLHFAKAARPNNPKLATQLLDEARQFVSHRAVNYQNFEQQLRVADAYKELEPARSVEILDSTILQLNELLTAAATLSGFEVNIFRDGELPLGAGSNLSNVVSRCAQEVGLLASVDFERAQALGNRFQLVETRIMVKLAMVRSLLGAPLPPAPSRGFGPRAFRQYSQFVP